MITKIRKRDGRLADYDISKIENAIAKAAINRGNHKGNPKIKSKFFILSLLKN